MGEILASPTRAETHLVLFLRLTAALLLPALGAVFMPFPWMDAVHQWLGLGELRDQPMTQYLARTLSALYAALGMMCLVVSRDVRRYTPLLRFSGWGSVVFGLWLLALDVTIGMPLLWTVFEAPFVVGYGIGLIWLVRRLESPGQPGSLPTTASSRR